MIRVLMFFVVVALLAFGATWLADHPGTVLVTWGGRDVQFSTLVGLVVVLAIAVVLTVVWTVLRFVFNVPSLVAMAGQARRRQRGLRSLSRGLMAVGSGDAAAAQRYASEAERYLRRDPMAMLLRAQAAQLSGDRAEARRTFTAMLEHDDTRTLGLRGLHMEALREGDADKAFAYASEAQKIAALPWAGHAVLQHRASQNDWAGALETVQRNAAGRLIDRPTANRQRAVLQTALALECEERSADEALALAREAVRAAPTLVPAAALAGRLLGRRGDLRKAAKIIETAFAATPHPDLAAAYVGLRPGDSAFDRLTRAEMLARQAPGQPESRLTVARAALEARDFNKARQVMSPLVNGEEGNRPTARTCLMMADIEEVEHGETGALLEWLQRAARAPHDPAWIADGFISDTWAPVSPVTGRIDAFAWETPKEQITPSEHRRALSDDRSEGDHGLASLAKPLPTLDEPAALLSSPEAVVPAPDVVTPGPVALASVERDASPVPIRRGSRRVVFPVSAAPDDPGPEDAARPAQVFDGSDSLGDGEGGSLRSGRI